MSFWKSLGNSVGDAAKAAAPYAAAFLGGPAGGSVMGLLSNKLGSFAANAASNYIGGKIDNKLSNERMTKTADTMMNQYGLTATEAFGAGGAGGVASGSSSGQTLTNSTSQQQIAKMQVDQQLARDKLQSDTQLATANIAAQAQIRSKELEVAATGQNVGVQSSTQIKAAEIAANAHKYSADSSQQSVLATLKQNSSVTSAQATNLASQTAKALQEIEQSKVVFSERWEKLFSTMSAENVLASVYAVLSGVSMQDVLKGAPGQSRGDLKEFVRLATSSGSIIQREFRGTSNVAVDNALTNTVSDIRRIIKALQEETNVLTKKQIEESSFNRKAVEFRLRQEAEAASADPPKK